MSEALNHVPSDLDAALQTSLHKHGAMMSSRDFLRVVSDVSESSNEPLTAGERSFLLEYTDLSKDDLSIEEQTRSKLFVLAEQTKSLLRAENSAYTTSEVAKIVGRDEANVRRAKANGDYYALSRNEGKQTLFPRWQFTDAGVVPGLKQIIAAFPRYFHPLSIESVMTQQNEDYLAGHSPIDWLVTGGAVEAVVEMVADLEFE